MTLSQRGAGPARRLLSETAAVLVGDSYLDPHTPTHTLTHTHLDDDAHRSETAAPLVGGAHLDAHLDPHLGFSRRPTVMVCVVCMVFTILT